MRPDPGRVAQIAAQPEEPEHRLACAEWFEEHGEGPRAELIRAQLALRTKSSGAGGPSGFGSVAKDFPKDGPLLIITGGECDRLQIRREHAYLLSRGWHLPFVPTGRVFRIV